MLDACLTCAEKLVPDPLHSHWKRCVSCDPEFGAWLKQHRQLEKQLLVAAQSAELQDKGRPTRGGILQ